MSLLEPDPEPGDPRRLALEGARTADRLRSLSLVRLGAPLGQGPSRAGAAVALAQDLADAAARLEGRPDRTLPELPDAAAGDVLAVCVTDLVAALERDGTSDGAALCAHFVARLRELRAQL